MRSRILARLQLFIEPATSSNRLPRLRATATALLDRFQRRWPDTPLLPAYPAFRS
jgi:hypothetical protein